MGQSDSAGIKTRILSLCQSGSKGTEFNPTGELSFGTDSDAMPPLCMYCLAKVTTELEPLSP